MVNFKDLELNKRRGRLLKEREYLRAYCSSLFCTFFSSVLRSYRNHSFGLHLMSKFWLLHEIQNWTEWVEIQYSLTLKEMTKEGDKKECRILHYVKPNNLIKIFGPTEKWQLADLTLKRLRRGGSIWLPLWFFQKFIFWWESETLLFCDF